MASSSQANSALSTPRPLLPLLKELPPALRGLTFPELFFNPPGQPQRELSSAERLALEELPNLQEIYLNDSRSALPRRCFALLKGEEILFFVVTPDRLFTLGSQAASMGDHSLFVSCDRPLLEQLFPAPLWEKIAALHSTEELLIAEGSLFEPFPSSISPQIAGLALSKGSTPLHSAAKDGHLESARLLLDAGARIDLINESGESPLDLALRWKQDAIIWLLIGGSGEALPHFVSEEAVVSGAASSSGPADPAGAAYREFEKAYDSGKLLPQLFWLEKLAQFSLDRREHLRAAHCLNGALALILSHPSDFEGREEKLIRLIGFQLERIERLFLEDRYQIKKQERCNDLISYRERLKSIRLQFAEQLSRGVLINQAQEFLTQNYHALLIALIKEAIVQIGEECPSGFAVMGLGSMARMEMCPYSDLEFAFLIDDSSEAKRDYFRKLSELLTLKMINMGETKFPLVRFKRGRGEAEDRPEKSLVPAGFSLDTGGLCPLGKEGIYELIGTPEKLAQYQSDIWFQDHNCEIIFVNALTLFSHIMGESALVDRYGAEVNRVLNANIGGWLPWNWKPFRESRAVRLIGGFLDEFQPKIDQDKVDLRAFDVKKELYRLPQTAISGLSLYYGLRGTNTLERIEGLERAGVLSSEGVNRLKQVFSSILKLRAEAHLFYKTEKEILYHPPAEERGGGGLLTISQEIGEQLLEIYRTLIPLHAGLRAFLAGDTSALALSPLYTLSIGSYDDGLRENLDYDAALQAAYGVVAFKPDSSSQWNLGLVHLDMGQAQKALPSLEEAYLLLKRDHGDRPHPGVAISLNSLGNVYHALGETRRSIDYFKQSLVMKRQIYGDRPHPDVAASLSNLGLVYRALGDYARAIDYSQQSLAMFKLVYGDRPHPEVAASLSNLGLAYGKLGETPRAIDYYEQSLAMFKQLYGDQPHPHIARILNNLGFVYGDLGEYARAIDYHEQSLAMYKQIHGDRPHPDVAATLNDLGKAYHELGEYARAIDYHQQSLAMFKQLYGDRPHPDVAAILMSLGNAYDALGEYPRAIDYYEQSLAIYKLIHGDRSHPDVAATLMNLGNAYDALGEYPRAIDYYEQSLAMYKLIHGDRPHPEVAASLSNLGLAYGKLGETPRTIDYYEQSLAMFKQLYGDQPHPHVARILNNLGNAYDALGEYPRAIDYSQQSLAIFKLVYGDRPHPQVAATLMSLGIAYDALGEYPRAIDYYEQSLAMYKLIHGDRPHPEVAASLSNLGLAYRKLGETPRAIDYFEQSLAMYKLIHGDRPHPQVATTLMNLGIAYDALGKTPLAIDYYEQSLAMYKLIHGDRPHPNVAASLSNLGLAYRKLGETPRAIDYYEQLLAMFKQLYGDRPHPGFAMSLMNLGNAYLSQGEYARAIDFYEQSLAMKRQIYGNRPHPSVATILNKLGRAYRDLKEFKKLVECYEASLAIYKQLHNDQPHPDIAGTLINLADGYNSLGAFSRAIECSNASLVMYRQLNGDELDINTAINYENLGDSYKGLGQFDRAVEFYTLAAEIYGEDHPNAAQVMENLAIALSLTGEGSNQQVEQN